MTDFNLFLYLHFGHVQCSSSNRTVHDRRRPWWCHCASLPTNRTHISMAFWYFVFRNSHHNKSLHSILFSVAFLFFFSIFFSSNGCCVRFVLSFYYYMASDRATAVGLALQWFRFFFSYERNKRNKYDFHCRCCTFEISSGWLANRTSCNGNVSQHYPFPL